MFDLSLISEGTFDRMAMVASGWFVKLVLLVERVSYTYGERAVEVRRGLSVTARHHYRNTLT